MERLFLRESEGGSAAFVIEKQKIGVVGMSGGAGVSFVATSLAKILSGIEGRKVTLLEIRDALSGKKPLIYDSIGMDKRFKNREFIRYYNEIKEGRGVRTKSNPDDRVNWGLITPEDVKDEIAVTPIEIVRLINNIPGDIIVCDISECENAGDYLIDMDYVIFVIDPLPARIMAGYPFMSEVKRLEHRGKKVVWIINKYNSGINKRDLHNFLKLKGHYTLPCVSPENFYNAEYNCKIPYEIAAVRDAVKDTIEKIIKNDLNF